MTKQGKRPAKKESKKEFKQEPQLPTQDDYQSIDFDSEWQRIRYCESELQELFTVYVVEELGAHLIKEAEDEFAIFGKCPVDMDRYEVFFTFWFHYLFLPESFEEEMTIAEAFLKAHPDKLTAYQKKFIKASVNSPCTFYEVVAVIPERRLVLQDLLLQKMVILKERMATLDLKEGLVLFGRHVTLEGQSIQLGLAPISLPGRCYDAAIAVRHALLEGKDNGFLTRAYLLENDFELREAYFDILQSASKPPEFINDDKEKIVLHDLLYDLTCSDMEAFESLKSLCPDHYLHDIEAHIKQGGPLHFPWAKTDTILAEMHIKHGCLKIFANSKERVAKIQQEVQTRLGDLAVLKETKIIDPAEMMREQIEEDR